jgi:diaminopimelate decarboxylase
MIRGSLRLRTGFFNTPISLLNVAVRRGPTSAGADVISEFELDLALRLNVPPELIIYNGPAKSDASLRTAINRGIKAININHLDEVARIRDIARQLGKQANVGVRVTGSGWVGQFGFPMDDPAALSAAMLE